MSGLIRKKTGMNAWETVEDTGGGGSQPTDEVMVFSETNYTGPTVPITAVAMDLSSLEVAGDQTKYLPFTAEVFAAAGDGLYINIVDAPDANGLHSASDATYDSMTDSTTVTFPGPLSDSPMGGNVHFLALTRYDIVLADEGSIEWVYVDVTADFASAGDIYFWVGDGDGINTFVPISQGGLTDYIVGNIGTWQWPMLTIDPNATLIDFAVATAIKRYPSGGVVSAILQQRVGGVGVGEMTVTVHHHFGELAIPVVEPTVAP